MELISYECFQRLNAQMNIERKNEVAYKQLALILDSFNWTGSAKWMHAASDEERGHYNKFAQWIITNNHTPIMEALSPALPSGSRPDGENLVKFYEIALKLEEENTKNIEELATYAEETEDNGTYMFLSEFLIDQRNGVKELKDILLTLHRLDKNGLVLWDMQLGD